MDNPQGKALSLDYLAGLVEGEGCFTLQVQEKRGPKVVVIPRFQIAMTDLLLIEDVSATLKHLGIGHHVGNYQPKGPRKPVKHIAITGLKRLKAFTDILAPHLQGEKKMDAEILQALVTSRLAQSDRADYTEREVELVNALSERHYAKRKVTLRPAGRYQPVGKRFSLAIENPSETTRRDTAANAV